MDAEVLGLFGAGKLRHSIFKLPNSPSACMLPILFGLTVGSATSSTSVFCMPTPANATVAARFAFFGKSSAAFDAVPLNKLVGFFILSKSKFFSAGVPLHAIGGLVEM